MSSTDSTDTSTTTTPEQTSQQKTVAYIKTVALSTIHIITTVAIGALIIYACKVGQSNILPTDVHCSPYIDNPATIKPIDININLSSVDGELLSQKISFPIELNSKNMILDFLRKYKEIPNSSSLVNYFIAIGESLIALDYGAYNMFFNSLNEAPDIIIILFGPILTFLYSIVISIINLIYICYLWFSKMSWLFKENVNNTNQGEPKWRNVTLLEPINYFLTLLLVFLFFILFWILVLNVFPIVCSIILIYCLFSTFGYTAVDTQDNKYSVFNCLKDVFKYKKSTIMWILSFCIIITAFGYLGATAGLLSMLTVVLVYFNIIPISVYSIHRPIHLSSLSSYEHALKVCKNLVTKKRGFWERLFYPQLGGSNEDIIKKMKKISSNLTKGE